MLGLLTLLLAANGVLAIPQPLVELKMNEGSGTAVANTGSFGGSASIMGAKPSWSTKAPVNGGSHSLDWGTTTNNAYALDLGSIDGLKNLKSFTITGWVNCRSATTGGGGNRIVTWINNGGHGVDLAFQSDGSLQLGINEWNDFAAIRSNGGKITVDANASFNNWRFFAVAYNSTLGSDQVRFYFGSNGATADYDVARTYARGTTGSSIAQVVTVGHHNTSLRSGNPTQMFRGLIDGIRIYGSTANGSGALTTSEIAEIQGASPLTGQGVLYEEWANVAGSAVGDLISHPEFPGNPSATHVRTSFDAFSNKGDNLGVRMSGWVKAPETGDYTFWIATDDRGELRLSTDANPMNKQIIASVSGYTNPYEWEKYPSQKSAPIPLEAGKFYYIEAYLKEATGNDHLHVGWQIPSGAYEKPIPAGRLYLSPGEGSGMFPSTVDLYEPGTSNKAATLGWHKETGNNHFYINTDNSPKLEIRNDVVTLPAKKLYFGGPEIEGVDLGVRYEPAENGSNSALIFGQDNAASWGMKIHSGQLNPLLPYIEINQKLVLTGPPVDGFDAEAVLHYFNGLTLTRVKEGQNGLSEEIYSTFHNAEALSIYSLRSGASDNEITQTFSSAGYTQMLSNVGTEQNEMEVSYDGWRHTTMVGGMITSNTTLDIGGLETTERVKANNMEANSMVTQTLTVGDEIVTNKWRIPVPDYVFEKGYKRKSLDEVERFVTEKKHLPDIPSAKEMHEKGMAMGEMNLRLLKTVEEMTLHMIDMNKELKRLRERNDSLATDLRGLKAPGKGR